MPFSFDIGKYSANYDPTKGGTFVNVQDVMASYGDVFSNIIALLPKLIDLIETLTPDQLIQILEVGLEGILNLLFPADGSLSPLLKAVIDLLLNMATDTQFWQQIISLMITLGPQMFLAFENLIAGGTGAELLTAAITFFGTVLTSDTSLLFGFTKDFPILQQLITAGGGSGSTLADFGGLFGALTSVAITSVTGLALGMLDWLQLGGALPVATTLGAGQLSGLAVDVLGWLTGNPALPSASTLNISQLVGLATGVATWIANGGALPSTATLLVGQLSNAATDVVAWLVSSGALPPSALLGVSQLTGLASGILSWLTAGGVLPTGTLLSASGLTGLASGIASWLSGGGALPTGSTLGVSGLTGLAGGVLTWLTSGGALPGASTLGVGQLSGLATGILSWLTGGGALPGGTTLGASGLTGLATGIATWLSGGGALPGGTSLGVGGLTGLASGISTWLGSGGALPSATTILGSGITNFSSIPDVQSMINKSVGAGGSAWSFPGFGSGANTLGTVGTAIAEAPELAQQMLDAHVQQYLGTTASGFSIEQYVAALQQQPTSTFGNVLTPDLLPDITASMSSAASTAINVAQGATDQLSSALQGTKLLNMTPAQLGTYFIQHLTGLVNNWQGTSLPTAATTQVNSAAQSAATQASQQSNLLSAIQSQLPHYYGGGGGGTSIQQLFTGSLPSGWTTLTPGSGPVYNCAINTNANALAQTDTQSVVGTWSAADNQPKAIIARSNLAGTSMHFAIIQSNTTTNNCKLGVMVGGVITILSTFALPGSGAFVANYNYTLNCSGRVLTLTGPNGLNQSVTDASNVGMIGSAYRYGGFGTGGKVVGSYGWGGSNGTFTPPAGLVAGDQYELAGVGAGGGGGGGVGAWGNGGVGGNVNTQLLTIGTDIAVGDTIAYTSGVGGAQGQSIYYVVQHQEFYTFSGNSGIITDTNSNAAYPGAAGTQSQLTWTKPGVGTQHLNCAGGAPGGVGGGAPTGGAGGSAYVNGDQFAGGPSSSGWTVTNGTAPDYNGGAGSAWGGGGTGCYSGTAQTSSNSFYDSGGNHWLYWYYGINAWQYAGTGSAGACWITAISRQLPGGISAWSFYDGALVGPNASSPGTALNTTSTAWVSTGAVTTVNIGNSGAALVLWGAEYIYNNTANDAGLMTFGESGANTLAPTSNPMTSYDQTAAANVVTGYAQAEYVQGLSPGSTTFTNYYRCVTGGITYLQSPYIIVIPF